MKLGLYIDDSERKCRKQEPYSYPVHLLSYLHITIYLFIIVACRGHTLESTKGIELNLDTYRDVNERKC